jgi:hypothetical protein
MCCRLGSIPDDICVRWKDGLEARRDQPYRRAGAWWEREREGEAVEERALEEVRLREEVQARADLAYVYVYAARYIGNERGRMIYLRSPVVRRGLHGLVGEG